MNKHAAVFAALLLAACSNPPTTDTGSTATNTVATQSDAASSSGQTATGASTDTATAPTTGAEMDTFAMPTNLQTTASGLQYSILEPGTGAQPQRGQMVQVHYTGWLTNGTKFDSSRDRGEPIEFPLGAGRVIDGWDEGIAAMKVGEKRTLVIPPALGYGDGGMGGVIPPNATLVFNVELVGAR